MPQQPPINTLCYNGQFWCGTFTTDEELLLIKTSDPTFQQHLNRYLESLGIPTQTYIQLLAHVQHVSEQRYQTRLLAHLRRPRSTDYTLPPQEVRDWLYRFKALRLRQEILRTKRTTQYIRRRRT